MRDKSTRSLDERLRMLLHSVVAGARSIEDATLTLRAEMIAQFMRGRECNEKRASNETRFNTEVL